MTGSPSSRSNTLSMPGKQQVPPVRWTERTLCPRMCFLTISAMRSNTGASVAAYASLPGPRFFSSASA